MEQEIIEGNKLIAEFMNEGKGAPLWEGFDHKSYHTSWDWLMPCLKEAKDKMPNRFWSKIFQSMQELEVSITWQEFVDFLKWYNQNKK